MLPEHLGHDGERVVGADRHHVRVHDVRDVHQCLLVLVGNVTEAYPPRALAVRADRAGRPVNGRWPR